MLDSDVRHRVDILLRSVHEAPDVLPIAEIAAIQETGLNVLVERSTDRPVVFITPRPDERLAGLTPREREVAALVAAGYSNGQLASALFVSLATVKDHLHSIFGRTGFTSRTQLIAAWYGGYRSPTASSSVPSPNGE